MIVLQISDRFQPHFKTCVICQLVSTRTVIGLGPISEIDIDESVGETPEQKLNSAAIDFLRKEIGVKVEEIKNSDIIKVFPANNPDLQRVYVQFSSKELVDLCLDLTRRLRKPELHVVLYVPRQFLLILKI